MRNSRQPVARIITPCLRRSDIANRIAAGRAVRLILIGLFIGIIAPMLQDFISSMSGPAGVIALIFTAMFALTALAGFFLICIGRFRLRAGFDDQAGLRGARLLFIASIPQLLAVFLQDYSWFFPVTSGAVSILYILFSLVLYFGSMVLNVLGFIAIGHSPALGSRSRLGTALLIVSSVLFGLTPVLNIIPLFNVQIFAQVPFVVLIFSVIGWLQIKADFEEY